MLNKTLLTHIFFCEFPEERIIEKARSAKFLEFPHFARNFAQIASKYANCAIY